MTVLLPLPAVLQRSSFGRSTFYRMLAEGKAPAPVQISERRVAWVETEIDEWLAAMAANCRKAA